MSKLTTRDLPEQVQITRRGHGIDAETRGTSELIINAERRVKLGSILAGLGVRAQLTDEEFAVFEQVRSDKKQGSFEADPN